MSPSVSRDVQLSCATPSGRHVTLAATLVYTVGDPYAVRVVFRSPHDDISWLVDRELLFAGLDAAAGIGDVRVRPSPGADRVEIRFRSPAGCLVGSLPRPELQDFLDRTRCMVPLGGERLDADELVWALLTSGTE